MVEFKLSGRTFALSFIGWLLFAFGLWIMIATVINPSDTIYFGMFLTLIAALLFAFKDSTVAHSP